MTSIRSAVETSIRAVVTRADGRVEDLGVVSYWHRSLWRRLLWRLVLVRG
jgi:hypothetical protein